MELQPDFIDQLENALSSKDIARRAAILRRVADLFVLHSGALPQEHVDLFDDVMSRLLDSVERNARAQFGNRMAKLADAPPRTVRTLALDDAIEVAGPVLQLCERVDEVTLLEVARQKGQQHLLAISGRRTIAEAVTDVLVERGDDAVVSSTAANGGARFSGSGVANLIEKAGGNAGLALSVWSRTDIPRQSLVKLFVDASRSVQQQMIEADPRRAELITAAVTEATAQVQDSARAGSSDFADARSFVEALHSAGELDEAQLQTFAGEGDFEKVVVALSLLCELPIGVVERAFVQEQTDQILVMSKAVDLSWVTTVALLLLQAGLAGGSGQQLDQYFARFSRLQTKTARTALQFYRMREKASRPASRESGEKD